MENSTLNKQTVGAQIPDRLFQLISLYSLEKDSSKSQVIRDALLLWAEENEVTRNKAIKELRHKYHAQWRRIKNKSPEKGSAPYTKDVFIKSKKNELSLRKISEDLINQIFIDF